MLVFTKALDKHESKDFLVALRANSDAEDDLESKGNLSVVAYNGSSR